jgi:preprotein translocase subunit SecE
MLTYIKESYKELTTNVKWLSWAEAQKLMVVVAVFSLLFSLATWGVDTAFSKLMQLYFQFIN